MKVLLESTKKWVDIDPLSVKDNWYLTKEKDRRWICDAEILRIVDDVRIGNPKFNPLPLFVKNPYGRLFEPFRAESRGNLGYTSFRYWYNIETLEYIIESDRKRFSGIARADMSHPYPLIEIDKPKMADGATINAFWDLKWRMTSTAGALVVYNSRVEDDDRYRNPDGTLLERVELGGKILVRPRKLIFEWM